MDIFPLRSNWSRAFKELRAAIVLCSAFVFSEPASAQQLVEPPTLTTVSPTGVDLYSSNLTASAQDFSIGDLSLTRSFFQLGMSHNLMGNWSHNFDAWVNFGIWNFQQQIHVVIGSNTYKFDGTFPGTATPHYDEFGLTLVELGGQIIFTDRDGTIYRFNELGQTNPLSSITRPDGSVINITYASGKPKTIVSSRGFAIVFDYAGNYTATACGYNLANKVVTTATTCSGAALKTSYAYTNGYLTAFTNASNDIAHYVYGNSSICFTDPGSNTCKITSTFVPGRPEIASQTMADGAVWQFSCSCGIDPDDFYNSGGYADPVGGTGLVWFYGENNTPQDYTISGKHYYLWMAGRYPVGATLPEGNIVWRNYSARNQPGGITIKAKPGSGQPDLHETWDYPASCTNPVTCNRPTTITDAKNNVTSFTYDPIHGGVLTETKPADTNGVQAVTRNTYGQRYAWILNSSGSYSHAGSPIWLLLEMRTCQTSATVGGTCAAGPTDEVVTTYDYGPDSGPNLLFPRGVIKTSNGTSLRTCFGYDWQGNKIYETSPRAGLTSCS